MCIIFAITIVSGKHFSPFANLASLSSRNRIKLNNFTVHILSSFYSSFYFYLFFLSQIIFFIFTGRHCTKHCTTDSDCIHHHVCRTDDTACHSWCIDIKHDVPPPVIGIYIFPFLLEFNVIII